MLYMEIVKTAPAVLMPKSPRAVVPRKAPTRPVSPTTPKQKSNEQTNLLKDVVEVPRITSTKKAGAKHGDAKEKAPVAVASTQSEKRKERSASKAKADKADKATKQSEAVLSSPRKRTKTQPKSAENQAKNDTDGARTQEKKPSSQKHTSSQELEEDELMGLDKDDKVLQMSKKELVEYLYANFQESVLRRYGMLITVRLWLVRCLFHVGRCVDGT